MRVRIVFLAALALAGCASNEPAAQSVAGGKSNNDDFICVKEYPLGSNIPVTRCRNTAQREQDKREADETLDAVRSRPGGVAGRATP